MADRFIRGCTSLPRGVEVEKREGRGRERFEGEKEKERQRETSDRTLSLHEARLARIPEVTNGITFR